MKDRVPKYPGRVTLVPVAGQENTFDMVRADEPTQSGDPLNKNTLLKDATASLFGMGAGAVPDDVLSYLGQYNQHWWWRKATTTNTEYREVRTKCSADIMIGNTGFAGTVNVTYSEEINIAADCTVSLKNPKTFAIKANNTVPAAEMNYILYGGVVYYTGGYLGRNSDGPLDMLRVYLPKEYTSIVTAESYEVPIGEVDYVHSSDRNAYPDSGVSGGYEYSYLGVPFENAVTAPNIVTGSYVGTGKYGNANKNTLTFGFTPRMVVVYKTNESSYPFRPGNGFWDRGFVWYTGQPRVSIHTASRFCEFEPTNDGLSYYSSKYADDQCNASGVTYYYLAIG